MIKLATQRTTLYGRKETYISSKAVHYSRYRVEKKLGDTIWGKLSIRVSKLIVGRQVGDAATVFYDGKDIWKKK